MDSPSSQTPRDGLIDFSQYSTTQLADLQYSVDRHSFPLNYRNLTKELERRQPPAEIATVAPDRWAVRFTRANGLLGWLQALKKWRPVYGEGWLEVLPDQIILHGWQRTWLGIAVQRTIAIPAARIHNVGQSGDLVRFDRRGRIGDVAFRAKSVEEARQIGISLPTTQTAGFEQKWAELGEFHRKLDAAGTHAWVTTALVVANFLIFAAMAIQQKRFYAFDLQSLEDWGGNYGLLTENGQWWRLLSAIFLHLDPAHVIVNMWALWNVGRLTERLYGRWVFLGLYLSVGLAASLASTVWDPTRVTVGASGAIFGVFGAFLAFLSLRRTYVPASIIRAHWLSTSAFVVFSLVSGMLQTGIDNSAHVGGLVAGFVLGWVVRPVGARQPLRRRQALIAATILLTAMTTGFLLTRGAGSQLTALERYVQSHDWYVRGEAQNLAQWQALSARAASGTISNLELGYQFETNILPFWVSSEARLWKDDAALPGNQAQFASMFLQYVQARREWAEAVISANKDRDGKTASDIQRLASEADKITARIQRISLREQMAHRPSALSNSTVVTYVRNHLFAANAVCVRRPEGFGPRVAEADLKSDGPATGEALGCQAQHAFDTDDFSALQTMLGEYGKTPDDLPNGMSRMGAAFNGLEDMFEFSQRNVLEDLGRTADWRRAFPDSTLPDLIDASLFHEWAWAARGSGTVDTISPQMSAFYNFRTEMAAAALLDTKDRGSVNPLWYQLSLEVGVDQSIGLPALRAIFDDGNAKFPNYLPLYRAMLRPLLPRWYGSYAEASQFITDMAEKAGPNDGKQRYALLWWSYDRMEEDRDNVFDEPGIDWSGVKTGFQGLLRRYPQSAYLVNAFAHMACQADAVTDYVELRPALDKRLSATAWSDAVSLQSCDDKFKEALHYAHVTH